MGSSCEEQKVIYPPLWLYISFLPQKNQNGFFCILWLYSLTFYSIKGEWLYSTNSNIIVTFLLIVGPQWSQSVDIILEILHLCLFVRVSACSRAVHPSFDHTNLPISYYLHLCRAIWLKLSMLVSVYVSFNSSVMLDVRYNFINANQIL